ncbi:BatA domain-containing protein [Schlesneria sp. T3-172]|uniref:BatA domain-containing protein n=1 Tax=Schlesneria sphaerica TaxID=3373610 RepID=UPI0037C673B1
MLSFDASSYALAGIAAAAGPVLIHLLNRRRFKTVNWAAMDFLRDALERTRKKLHLRDVLLLALRILTIALFGLMLARPYFKGASSGQAWQNALLVATLVTTFGLAIHWATSTEGKRSRIVTGGLLFGVLISGFQLFGLSQRNLTSGDSRFSSRMPLHAILVVDNSRSMGVESLGTRLLDRAKSKASEFINSLPLESRISVIPLAGSETPYTLEGYRNKEDARRALDRIPLVDTEGSIRSGLELAVQATQQTADPPAKRVVLFTDLQETGWQATVAPELMQQLTGMQIVQVATSPARNVWVSGLHVEDGLTSAEVPCRLLARLNANRVETSSIRESEDPPFRVQVRLLIDGVEVASQTLEVSPGQEREIEFIHQFETTPDPLKPEWTVATVIARPEQLSIDQLAEDNRQQIVVPVVSSLPVVFVDQFGDDENLEQNRIGETYALRHLLAPRSSVDKLQQRLIQTIHLRGDQITQEILETARLVIIAGVEKPDESTISLLHDYVQQGGPLVVLAGAHFDPSAWTERAWRSGQGILPVPLAASPIGMTPEESSQQIRPFYLAFETMQHDFFLVEGEDPQTLSALFDATPFFKAVQATMSPDLLSDLLEADTRRLTERQQFLEAYEARPSSRADNSAVVEEAERTYRRWEPSWWNWRSPLPLVDRTLGPAELAKRSQPRVLAAFDGEGMPYLLERRIGAGRLLLFTSGVTSNWNLLKSSGAMYFFHRTCSQLMEETLPRRNYLAGQKITLPVERSDELGYGVIRPSGIREALYVEAINSNVSGVTIRRPVRAGTYLVQSEQGAHGDTSAARLVDEIPIAVNGAESESNLTVLPAATLMQQLDQYEIRVLTANDPIRLEGGSSRGRNLWKGFGWSVLACLLWEMFIVAGPSLKLRGQVVSS